MTDSSADKPQADSKGREWTLGGTAGAVTGGIPHDLILEPDYGTKPQLAPGEVVHVIEMSAYLKLERERDEIKKMYDMANIFQLTQERDKYRAALEDIANNSPRAGYICEEIAREALNSSDLPPFTVAGNPSESEIAGERKG